MTQPTNEDTLREKLIDATRSKSGVRLIGDEKVEAILALLSEQLTVREGGWQVVKPSKRIRFTIDENHIVINAGNRQINFGKYKPPHDYLVIAFDRAAKRLKLVKGDANNGYSYKVGRNKVNGSYSISPRSFIEQGILPVGLYEKLSNGTYQHVATLERKEKQDG